MKIRTYLLLFVAMCFVIQSSCNDFIEQDLKNKKTTILFPADSSTSSSTDVEFRWDETEGALFYNVRIVQPSFAAIKSVLADTNVNGLRFIQALLPGKYEWQIRPENSSSQGAYTTYTLFVDSTKSLTGQTITIISPTNDSVSGASKIRLKWKLNSSATFYQADVLDASTNNVLQRKSFIEKDTVTFFLDEGTYVLRVRGENDHSVTVYSRVNVQIDRTAPGLPVLKNPIGADSVTVPFTLVWEDAVNTGSTIKDSLWVYSDSSMTKLKIQKYLAAESYRVDTLAKGKYYWKIKSIDQGGNRSEASVPASFIVK